MNRWLERLFLLLIFSLGFMQPSINVSGLRATLTDGLFLLVSVVFAAAWLSRKTDLSPDTIYKYLAAFLLAMAMSAVFSIEPTISSIKLAGVAYLIALTILTINVVRTRRLLKASILIWMAASSVVCVIGVITVVLFYGDRTSPWHSLFLHHYGSLPVGNYPRIQSTFLYPAMLCNYLTAGFLLALAVKRLGWINGKTAAICLALHAIAAIFTLTPGLGGLFFAVSLWVGFSKTEQKQRFLRRTIFAAGSFIFIASLAVSAFSIWPITTSPFMFDVYWLRIDPTQRLLAWRDAIETFFEHPLFGKGIGIAVADVRFQAPSGQMQLLTDAHNTFLSIAAQAGGLGFSTFVAVMISTLKRGLIVRVNGILKSPVRLALTIAFVSGIALQGMVGSFEDARHLWVLLGLIIAASRIEVSDQTDN